MEPLYDPPLSPSSLRSSNRRGRSASFSASSVANPPLVGRTSSTLNRRPSLSSLPAYAAGNLSDDEEHQEAPLVDLNPGSGMGAGRPSMDFPTRKRSLSGPSKQDASDARADRSSQREGRQSKASLLKEKPGLKMTADMEGLYDLTHSIDCLENDIGSILSLRNAIVTLDPKVDIGQVSLRADLDSLSSLTTQTGKTIVSLETWLWQLHEWSWNLRKMVKAGQAGETLQEVGEIKFQLASAKLDFADAMDRIREGAFKEQERRSRTRIWMARHIRSREPDIEDHDVRGLLKAAELGAADGVAQSHVTSYAGLWALQNPFTELAELTNGMRFLHDDLDREIVNDATGKSRKKRPNSKKSKKKSSSSKKSSSRPSKKSAQVSPGPPAQWFGSRYSFISNMRPNRSSPGSPEASEFERKFRYIQAEQYAAEKDLEYGYARQAMLDRVNRRKKLVIALLLVIIAALILFVALATMKVPDRQALIDGLNNNGTSAVSSTSTDPALPPNAALPTTTADTWAISSPASSPSSAAETITSAASTSRSSSSAAQQMPERSSASSLMSVSTGGSLSSSSPAAHSDGMYRETLPMATQAGGAATLTQGQAATQAATQTQPMVWWTARYARD
ncbi:hypothetical protein JCM11251_004034 [Rhodosporidiobolus azoricus]